jgi:hypothetical protein
VVVDFVALVLVNELRFWSVSSRVLLAKPELFVVEVLLMLLLLLLFGVLAAVMLLLLLWLLG